MSECTTILQSAVEGTNHTGTGNLLFEKADLVDLADRPIRSVSDGIRTM
jgi:hypothetical protein